MSDGAVVALVVTVIALVVIGWGFITDYLDQRPGDSDGGGD